MRSALITSWCLCVQMLVETLMGLWVNLLFDIDTDKKMNRRMSVRSEEVHDFKNHVMSMIAADEDTVFPAHLFGTR